MRGHENLTPPEGYGDNFLQLKDLKTRKSTWEWDDLFEKGISNTIGQSIGIHQGRMLLHDGRAEGKPAERISRQFSISVSDTTLLRMICKVSLPKYCTITAIGVDDCGAARAGF